MNSDSMMILCVTACVVLFIGEPDLLDALIKVLSK